MPNKKPRVIEVLGRRWFQKSYGNTYHTAEVSVDGVLVLKTDREYGYGTQYLQTAIRELVAKGLVPAPERHSNGMTEDYRGWAERNGFTLRHTAVDVGKKSDL